MPLMTKIRENMTTAFAVFAGVFVVYIVLDWGMDLTGRRQAQRSMEAQEIGRINESSILYKDFAEVLKQAVENQKTQTGSEPDEETVRTLREQLWNQMVQDKLYEQEIERLQLTVTNQEIIDWVRGPNPPQFLTQQFVDSLGNFNRVAYEQAIMDPKNQSIMVQVEDMLRKQRLREKVQSIVNASVRVSAGEVEQRFKDQSIQYVMDYALFDPNILVKDDEVTVSDDDLRLFYNEHSLEFKVEAARKLKYVTFVEAPSRSDTDGVIDELNALLKSAREGSDFENLANTYSETPPSDAFFKHGEMTPERERAVFDAKPGEIIGPLNVADGYSLIRVEEFKPGTEEYIRASHILITIENNDSVKALAEARSLMKEIQNGADFVSIAKSSSKDQSSATNDGDLGWFNKGRMVKPFEDAAFKARVGQVVGPVRTQFGYHLIKVTGRDKREVRFTELKMSVRIGSQTRETISQAAQDFHYLAKENDFIKEAEIAKYTVNETPAFQKDAMIPGFGSNPAITKFAFNSSVGDISDVLTVSKGYAVFMLSEAKEAGVKPLDELKASLEPRVRREKKLEKVKTIVEELRASLAAGDSLSAINGKRPPVTVSRVGPFTFQQGVTGIGRDWGFLGGLSQLKPGEISPPILGNRGYYLALIISETAFDSTIFRAQRDILTLQLLTERRNRFTAEWFDQLRKSATIIDNRDFFYR